MTWEFLLYENFHYNLKYIRSFSTLHALADNMTNEVKYKVTVNITADAYCEDLFILPFIDVVGYDRYSKFCVNLTETVCRGAGIVMTTDWTVPRQAYMFIVGFYVAVPDYCLGYQQVEKITAHMQWITYIIEQT